MTLLERANLQLTAAANIHLPVSWESIRWPTVQHMLQLVQDIQEPQQLFSESHPHTSQGLNLQVVTSGPIVVTVTLSGPSHGFEKRCPNT